MSQLTWKETRFLNVPLTQDEMRQRGEQLADIIKERDELALEQKKERDAMKEAMETVEGRIRHLASVVNARVEERSVQVEIRYSTTLHMIEEVRTDTGEVVKTRTPTEDDKVRAAAEQQTRIPGTEAPQA